MTNTKELEEARKIIAQIPEERKTEILLELLAERGAIKELLTHKTPNKPTPQHRAV